MDWEWSLSAAGDLINVGLSRHIKIIYYSISVLLFVAGTAGRRDSRISRMRMQRVLCRRKSSQGIFSDIDESKLDTWDLW